jgi:hypothetical protein
MSFCRQKPTMLTSWHCPTLRCTAAPIVIPEGKAHGRRMMSKIFRQRLST